MRLILLAILALSPAISPALSLAADKAPATQPANQSKPKPKHYYNSWAQGIDTLNLPPDRKAQTEKVFDEHDLKYKVFFETYGKEREALYSENFRARKAKDKATAEKTSKRLIELGVIQMDFDRQALKQIALILTPEQYARFRTNAKLQYLLTWSLALDVLDLPADKKAQVTRIFQNLEEQTNAREDKNTIEYDALTVRCHRAQSVGDFPVMNDANKLAALLDSQHITLQMNARTQLTRALTPAQLARFDNLTTCPRGIFSKKSNSYVWGSQRADFNPQQVAAAQDGLIKMAASIARLQTPMDNEPDPIREDFTQTARKSLEENMYQALVPFTDLERMDLICARPPQPYFNYFSPIDLQPYQLESMHESITRMQSQLRATPSDAEKSLIVETALRQTFAILTYSQRYFIISHMYADPHLNPTRFANDR